MRSKIREIVTGKSGKIYNQCMELIDEYKSPHAFVANFYGKYKELFPNHRKTKSINGRIFEYAICETLAHEEITPFYYQTRFERVPNADFDIVLYDTKRPVVLTMKVSMRERYKQADLEGMALRNVYRKAENYLITLEAREAPGVVRKITNGDIVGLDKCVLADRKEYSELIKELSSHRFSVAERVMPINAQRCFPASSI